MVKLGKLEPFAGAQTLTVKGTNMLTVQDVLVGKVWLGSGQSNMAMLVQGASNAPAEIAAAKFPLLRLFTIRSGPAATAQADCAGAWVVCSPETVARLSATAYYFGRELHQALGVPVGLINSSVGGTPIESWISPEAQKGSPELKALFEAEAEAARDFDTDAAKARYERDRGAVAKLRGWRGSRLANDPRSDVEDAQREKHRHGDRDRHR